MPPIHDHHQTSLFATSFAGCCWWLLDQLAQHGPSWQLVPPLLIGSASLLGAVRSTLDGAQARRHAEERHRAALTTPAVAPDAPGRFSPQGMMIRFSKGS